MAEKFEVAKAYVTIVPSMKDSRKIISSELTGITDSASDEAGRSGGARFGSAFANVVKTSTAVIGAAVGAAAAGITALTKEAVEAYGNYEQLVGGVDKIFGEASASVIENASRAFQTAGMSANTYMETVTGFSASLLQGLGGDAELAAQIADQAIQDMSDNANTYGTDLSSIQNAYMGFAKGNFTMLDNLKLGYGGTKEEMIRLINESGILNETITSLDDVTFDQMIAAIHAVQTNLNITGTTANEASGTIQGSLGTLKGAWENLITGLGDSSQDLGPLIDNVVESALNVVNNIEPIAIQAIRGLSQMISKAAPILSSQIPTMVSELLPPLLEAATDLVMAVVENLPTIFNILTTQIPVILGKAIPAILNILPVVINSVMQLLTQLVTWLSESGNVKVLINGIMQVVSFAADAIGDSLPILLPALLNIIGQITETLTEPANVEMIIDSVLYVIGAVVMALVESLPEIGYIIVETLLNLADLLADFYEWIVPIVTDGIEWCVNAVKNFSNNVRNVITSWIANILNKIREFWNDLKTGVGNILTTITTNISNIKNKIGTLVSNIISTIGELPTKVVSIGKNLITGLWNGISDRVVWVISKIRNMGSSIIKAVKKVFGIASPSKVFAELGAFTAEGFGIGFSDPMEDV